MFGFQRVKIYSVYVNRSCNHENFYTEIAKRTGGRKVELENFSNMFDFIMAICYREHGAEFLDVSDKIKLVKKLLSYIFISSLINMDLYRR